MRNLFLLIGFIFLVSCSSNHNENRVQITQTHLNGGFSAMGSWDDDFIIERITWISGMNTFYDAFFSELDQNSKFFTWLSKENQKSIKNECKQFIVTFIYSASPTLVTHAQFVKEVRENGFKDYFIPNFSASVRSHPDYMRLHIENAKIMGFCKTEGERLESLDLVLPSFPLVKVKL